MGGEDGSRLFRREQFLNKQKNVSKSLLVNQLYSNKNLKKNKAHWWEKEQHVGNCKQSVVDGVSTRRQQEGKDDTEEAVMGEILRSPENYDIILWEWRTITERL